LSTNGPVSGYHGTRSVEPGAKQFDFDVRFAFDASFPANTEALFAYLTNSPNNAELSISKTATNSFRISLNPRYGGQSAGLFTITDATPANTWLHASLRVNRFASLLQASIADNCTISKRDATVPPGSGTGYRQALVGLDTQIPGLTVQYDNLLLRDVPDF
jgi:hypothetical protein